jgi:hypothetical protein
MRHASMAAYRGAIESKRAGPLAWVVLLSDI